MAQRPDRAGRCGHADEPVGQLVELPLVAGCGDADRGAAQVDARKPLAELEVLDPAAHVLGRLREAARPPAAGAARAARRGARRARAGRRGRGRRRRGTRRSGAGSASAPGGSGATTATDGQVPGPLQRGDGLGGVLEQLVERGPVAGVDELAEQVPRPLPVGARVHGAQRPVHEARHGRDGLAAHPVDPGRAARARWPRPGRAAACAPPARRAPRPPAGAAPGRRRAAAGRRVRRGRATAVTSSLRSSRSSPGDRSGRESSPRSATSGRSAARTAASSSVVAAVTSTRRPSPTSAATASATAAGRVVLQDQQRRDPHRRADGGGVLGAACAARGCRRGWRPTPRRGGAVPAGPRRPRSCGGSAPGPSPVASSEPAAARRSTNTARSASAPSAALSSGPCSTCSPPMPSPLLGDGHPSYRADRQNVARRSGYSATSGRRMVTYGAGRPLRRVRTRSRSGERRSATHWTGRAVPRRRPVVVRRCSERFSRRFPPPRLATGRNRSEPSSAR